ncbi:MAG: glycoside hydrolase family 28, partial [Schleiferilactobacillus harbinensis]
MIATQFIITDYGAEAGADTVQTKPIQAAIDACRTAGGGTVVVPAGRVSTGRFGLFSPIPLHVPSGGVVP